MIIVKEYDHLNLSYIQVKTLNNKEFWNSTTVWENLNLSLEKGRWFMDDNRKEAIWGQT